MNEIVKSERERDVAAPTVLPSCTTLTSRAKRIGTVVNTGCRSAAAAHEDAVAAARVRPTHECANSCAEETWFRLAAAAKCLSSSLSSSSALGAANFQREGLALWDVGNCGHEVASRECPSAGSIHMTLSTRPPLGAGGRRAGRAQCRRSAPRWNTT
jgi:hypothetical protein